MTISETVIQHINAPKSEVVS